MKLGLNKWLVVISLAILLGSGSSILCYGGTFNSYPKATAGEVSQGDELAIWNSGKLKNLAILQLQKYWSIVTGSDTIDMYGDDLGAAVAAIGSTPKTLIINGVVNVSSSLTIPDTLVISPRMGCMITPASGVTVTIGKLSETSPFQWFDASHGGTLKLGPAAVHVLYAEWLGAKADGITDSTAAIQGILDCRITDQGGVLQLGSGTYVTGSVHMRGHWVVLGSGKKSTIWQLKSGVNDHLLNFNDPACIYTTVRDLTLDGNRANQTPGSTADVLFLYRGSTDSSHGMMQVNLIDNLEIYGATRHGVYIAGYCAGTILSGLDIHHCDGCGVYLDSAHDIILHGLDIWYCLLDGLKGYQGINIMLSASKAWANSGCGFNIIGTSTRNAENYSLTNVVAQENFQHGIQLYRAINATLAGCGGDGNSITAYGQIQDGSQLYDGFHIELSDHVTITGYADIWTMRNTTPLKNQRYGIYISSDCNYISANITAREHTSTGSAPYYYHKSFGAHNNVIVNGDVLSSDVPLVAYVSLSPAANGAYTFNWQNPSAWDIIVSRVLISVTTPGSSGSTISVGRASSSGGTINSSIISNSSIAASGIILANSSPVAVNANGGSSPWIVGQIGGADALALAGTVRIEYFER